MKTTISFIFWFLSNSLGATFIFLIKHIIMEILNDITKLFSKLCNFFATWSYPITCSECKPMIMSNMPCETLLAMLTHQHYHCILPLACLIHFVNTPCRLLTWNTLLFQLGKWQMDTNLMDSYLSLHSKWEDRWLWNANLDNIELWHNI